MNYKRYSPPMALERDLLEAGSELLELSQNRPKNVIPADIYRIMRDIDELLSSNNPNNLSASYWDKLLEHMKQYYSDTVSYIIIHSLYEFRFMSKYDGSVLLSGTEKDSVLVRRDSWDDSEDEPAKELEASFTFPDGISFSFSYSTANGAFPPSTIIYRFGKKIDSFESSWESCNGSKQLLIPNNIRSPNGNKVLDYFNNYEFKMLRIESWMQHLQEKIDLYEEPSPTLVIQEDWNREMEFYIDERMTLSQYMMHNQPNKDPHIVAIKEFPTLGKALAYCYEKKTEENKLSNPRFRKVTKRNPKNIGSEKLAGLTSFLMGKSSKR